MIRIWIPMLLLAIAFAGRASGQGHDPACPNQKASQVRSEVKNIGDAKTCGIGIVVFGIGGGIFGETCHPTKHTYPAHQVCNGEYGDHMRCTLEQSLDIKEEKCKCGGLVLPILQTGIPTSCVCSDNGPRGSIEDFKTEACPGV